MTDTALINSRPNPCPRCEARKWRGPCPGHVIGGKGEEFTADEIDFLVELFRAEEELESAPLRDKSEYDYSSKPIQTWTDKPEKETATTERPELTDGNNNLAQALIEMLKLLLVEPDYKTGVLVIRLGNGATREQELLLQTLLKSISNDLASFQNSEPFKEKLSQLGISPSNVYMTMDGNTLKMTPARPELFALFMQHYKLTPQPGAKNVLDEETLRRFNPSPFSMRPRGF